MVSYHCRLLLSIGKIRCALIAEQMADLIKPSQLKPNKPNGPENRLGQHHGSSYQSPYCRNRPPEKHVHYPAHSSDASGLDKSGSARHKLSHSTHQDLPQPHCMTTFNAHLFGSYPEEENKLYFRFSDSHGFSQSDPDALCKERVNPSISTLSRETFPGIDTSVHSRDARCSTGMEPKVEELQVKSNPDCSDSFANGENPTYEESLEARIQKLLKLNALTSNMDVGGTSPNVPASCPTVEKPTTVTYSENVTTEAVVHTGCDFTSSTHVTDVNTPVSTTLKTNISKAPISVSTSKSTLSVTSPASVSRRTLLPTPDVTTDSQKTPPLALHRPPLLKTPAQPVDEHDITKLTDEVFNLFTNELKEIIKRDLTRRIIEGNAFKAFSTWWESRERSKVSLCCHFGE